MRSIKSDYFPTKKVSLKCIICTNCSKAIKNWVFAMLLHPWHTHTVKKCVNSCVVSLFRAFFPTYLVVLLWEGQIEAWVVLCTGFLVTLMIVAPLWLGIRKAFSRSLTARGSTKAASGVIVVRTGLVLLEILLMTLW